MANDDPLLETLDAVLDEAHGNTVAFGALIDRVQERGYGPLIAFFSVFVILPTGAIPGIPALIGICLVLLGVQMLIGRSPWFPDRLEQVNIETKRLRNGIKKARPWAKKVDAFITQRFHFLTTGPFAYRITGLCIIVSGAIMVPLGFIPFAPMILGLSSLTLGIGTTAKDGFWVGLGYILFFVGGYLAFAAMP